MEWRRVPLSAAAGTSGLITDGDWIVASNMDPNGDIRLIQLADIGIGAFLDQSARFINRTKFAELGCTALQKNDVLISRMADPIGRACLLPDLPYKAITAVDVTILRCDISVANPRFLVYYCNTKEFHDAARDAATGTTRSRVTRRNLERLPIPLPPPSEQRRIVEILDQVGRLRSLRVKADTIADRILPALFINMFGDPASNLTGWPLLPFGMVFVDITSQCPKLQRKEYRATGRFPVVDQGRELVAGYCDDEDLCYRPERPVVVFGDHTRVVKFVDFPFVAGADGSRVFSVSRSFVPEFAAMLLRLQPIPELGYSRHMRAVRQLHFIAPPLVNQTQFADAYRSYHRTAVLRGRALEQVEGLWKVLLARAFSGSLTSSWREIHIQELQQELEHQTKSLTTG